jgi:hemerythrin superfamily protein
MTDLIEVLVDDHRRVETLLVELEAGTGDPEHRRAVADVVIAEWVRHAVAEELYLHPVLGEALPDGEHLTQHETRALALAEQTLHDLDGVPATDPAFDDTLPTLIAAVRQHVAEQERDLFPRVRQSSPPARLDDLGNRAEAAKRIAPTRPHPNLPVNRLTAPGTGLIDRIRDAMTKRPTQPGDL